MSLPDAGPRSAPIWIARSTTSCARPLASYATICTTAGPEGRGSGSGNVMMKVRPGLRSRSPGRVIGPPVRTTMGSALRDCSTTWTRHDDSRT